MPETKSLMQMRAHNAGKQVFGPWEMPSGTDRILYAIRRCSGVEPDVWDDDTARIALDAVFSFDGGNTWTKEGEIRFEQEGGVKLGRDGQPIRESSGELGCWYGDGDKRITPTHVMVTVTMSKGAKTRVDIELPDAKQKAR